ncbi:uncharacterized protein LOC120286679 [Eucalyptus grandis]|uniref:uncharacterized protein LOC120286679 n=1 Tax=Eucalyptus grandis TaxID=71139 RepID=UPI00192ECA2B|nr:uncharacterized protein LOC120286679 [Eucalyptus grandis]
MEKNIMVQILVAENDSLLHTQLWIDPGEEFVHYAHNGSPVDVTFAVKGNFLHSVRDVKWTCICTLRGQASTYFWKTELTCLSWALIINSIGLLVSSRLLVVLDVF